MAVVLQIREVVVLQNSAGMQLPTNGQTIAVPVAYQQSPGVHQGNTNGVGQPGSVVATGAHSADSGRLVAGSSGVLTPQPQVCGRSVQSWCS